MNAESVVEFSDNQIRQVIDAESVFRAWVQAKKQSKDVRGSMFWREQSGRTYLIRRNSAGAQTSLGPQSGETEAILARFSQRKNEAEQRERRLRREIETHRRMNRALQVGRVSPSVVAILNALDTHGVAEEFRVVGTHALFAYAAAARVHLTPSATATRDVDLLFDMRRRLRFVRAMGGSERSFLGIIQSADPSFRLRSDQLYTAINDQGFEVDVIRRAVEEDDPHPLRMTESVEDFWAVQASMGGRMQDGGLLRQVVIATDGSMAVMRTITPDVFCAVKIALARRPDRDPGKARRDRAQADLVQSLVAEYLPQFAAGAEIPPAVPAP